VAVSLRGLVVPGYVIGEMTESMTFGLVCSAVEEVTGREVSLRVLDLAEATDAARASFEQEMKVLVRLSSHPNVVTLFAVTQAVGGTPILVTEPCGPPLAASLASSGPFDPELAVSFAIKLAGALGVAHASGLIHRDVNPTNVRRSLYDEPLLDGFGMAQLAGDFQASTSFQSVCIAPELLEGRPATPETDVYGLAATLYCLVSSRPLFPSFSGESPAAVGLRILTEDPMPLTGSPELLAISDALASALSKDPSDRAPTVLELAGVLREVQRLGGWGATPASVLPPVGSTPSQPTFEERGFRPTPAPAVPPVEGATPGEVPPGTRRCPSGHEVPATARFCRRCGEPIDLEQAPSPMVFEQRIDRPAIGLPRLAVDQPELEPVEHAEERPAPSGTEAVDGDRPHAPRLANPEPRGPRVVLSPEPMAPPPPPIRRESPAAGLPEPPLVEADRGIVPPSPEPVEARSMPDKRRGLLRRQRPLRPTTDPPEVDGEDDDPGFGFPSTR